MKKSSLAASLKSLFQSRSHRTAGSKPARVGRERPGQMERLEERRVMAFDLVAAYASSDRPFFVSGQVAETLTDAPQQITVRFSPGTTVDSNTLGSIQVVRSGGAADPFGNGNDISIVPGSVTVDDLPNANQVTIRFKETLPDDAYRIAIGPGLKTTSGEAFRNGGSAAIDVRVDLGAFVVSVVPQPVSRNPAGGLQQNRDEIAVYFNRNDPLNVASAQTPASYRLFELDPATGDDRFPLSPINPTGVSYDQSTGKAVLSFAPGAIADDRQYRLQVGSAEALVAASAPVGEAINSNSSFATAQNLGTIGTGGAVVNGSIVAQGTVATPAGNLGFPSQPGSSDEPGHRNVPSEYGNTHGAPGQTIAPSGPIQVVEYNFQSVYGTDPQGNTLYNAITEAQKQRAREIFGIYSRVVGVRFVETQNSGLTVVTGDMRALDPNINTAPSGLAGPGMAIMDSTENWGSSEYGGAWFRVAMHEIGHSLGLDHTYDLSAIMSDLTGEGVFPGDYDTIHLAQLYPANGSDVDVYQFSLPTAGRLTAETIVGRPGQPVVSLLDSVLTLYRLDPSTGKRELIARNDDFYGIDSFIGLDLDQGTYFLAVTSAGNTAFDPAVADSGYGGRSDGDYQIRLGFQPKSSAATTIVDASGTAIDGDRDGRPGGAFQFWFNTASAANTLHVDKTAPTGGNGSLATPFNTIKDAIAATTPTTRVIRIAGNTAATPYQIGTDLAGRPLSDGATFVVPRGVTVMIDEGAILKLRAAIVDVGSSSAIVSRAGASLQVLGTPTNNVQFTSYHNDSVGGNSDGVGPAVAGGQWGGLVFRADSDSPTKKAFVNSISQATITYGGGQVFVDSRLDSFAPIQLESSRPTLAFNTIQNSVGAAIAATPNSFEDGNGRVGPEIRGNTLLGNSINGLFVKIRTEFGSPVDRLDVPARFRSTDIVYVLQDNLLINGGTGGYIENAGVRTARSSGRLAADPGVIVKLQAARIELERGTSQLIAEGTAGRPVIFTSLGDSRFGAGGTFDTNGNLPDVRAAGDWGGIVLNAGAKASIDHAYIAHGGGQTPIEGTFDRFNVIETHQGDLRLANSRVENNAAGTSTTDRTGRGANVAATIFVRGGQPVILGNDFRNNQGALVSINANAMSDVERPDPGRSSGLVDRNASHDDNRGPLVAENRLISTVAGAIAGLQVRGDEITVESVWDDVDIVHVLQNEIIVQNFHTATGVRLVSRSDASLVVKLAGTNAGFTAAGYGLDINDRIGGTVQILGQPGYAVVLTSLNDDSVGASLDPLGRPMNDTNSNGASVGAAGDWRSLKFLPMSNDRNVSIQQERELPLTGGIDINGAPAAAQPLGVLAPNFATGANTTESAQEKSGDDNRRLGFEVHGRISNDSPQDVDVYSFVGYGGSEVWIDLDKTSTAFDGMVELLDAAGTVLARSADGQTDFQLSGATRGIGLNLAKDAWRGGDFYSVNPKDPGMRVVLPGVTGAQSQYYIRVRSQPTYSAATTKPAYEAVLQSSPAAAPGATSGAYELRVRLQQRDEKPGSTVRYADIRFPTTGIDIQGLPLHSLLTGETGEATGSANDIFGEAQYVGNLLQSDRATISVAGEITSEADVDWYSFALNYEQLQNIGGVNGGPKSWSTVFDLDYGDGFRGDLTLSVFDATGRLLYTGRDSNVDSDQPGAGQGNDFDDLSRGTLGKLDAFIGSVQMPAGSPTGSRNQSNPAAQTRYFVAVSSNERLPTVLDATFRSAATNGLIRLEPVNSVDRLIEDHIGFTGYTSGGTVIDQTTVDPGTGATRPLIDIANSLSLSTHVTPFTLSDVTLFVSTRRSLVTVDAMRGGVETTIEDDYGPDRDIGDLVMRTDGRLYAYAGINAANNNTAGRVDLVNPGTGARTTEWNDAIPDTEVNTSAVNAIAWQRTGNGVYNDLYYSVDAGANSRLYRANPGSGSAVTPNPNPQGYGFQGTIQDGGSRLGEVTGMAFVNGTLYGVDTNGYFFRINTNTAVATLIDMDPLTPGVADPVAGAQFAGLSIGPQNLYGGSLANTLFAITSTGQLHAFGIDGARQNVFDSDSNGIADAASIAVGVFGGVTGLAFSPLDVNLWHSTTRRGDDAGHGINPALDNTRNGSVNQPVVDERGTTRSYAESQGGVSMYFGLEGYVDTGVTPYLNYQSARQQYGVVGSNWQRDLTTATGVVAPNSYDLPGGAYGSLTTNSFSLQGYDYTDKPALYFNYRLETENSNFNDDRMRDSARAYVSIDSGVTWQLVATNNSVRSLANTSDAELPAFASVSSRISNGLIDNQHVQELFDGAGWRQARVDLGSFAGANDVRLRFDFSTAGRFDDTARNAAGDLINQINGLAGIRGNLNSATRGQNNTFEGFYIDDIIVGFAERGEMVTGAVANQTGFFDVGTPTGGTPTVPSQTLQGPYQLEIRGGTPYGVVANPLTGAVAVSATYDTNADLVERNGLLGDANTRRDQGQFLVENNIVSSASGYGISIDAGPRDATASTSFPGVVRNLPVLNNSRLVPGVVVSNNIIASSGVGGISFSGDPNSGAVPTAAVPFGRIVNNTIYGGPTQSGTGVAVSDNAGPTLLNNLFANLAAAVTVDATSRVDGAGNQRTVIGTSAFWNVGSQVTAGVTQNQGLVLDADPFVNAASRNFYLAAGSRAIDSALDSLADRNELVVVTSAINVPQSPIMAPDRDFYGQVRSDDPTQASIPGLGSNGFRDRGAVDRVDVAQPYLSLVEPLDGSPSDKNGDPNSVRLEKADARGLTRFVLQLNDNGVGIDHATVRQQAFVLTRDGVALVAGQDYGFVYNQNTKQVAFEAAAVYVPGRYLITANTVATVSGAPGLLTDLANNTLLANQPGGAAMFEVVLADVPGVPTAVTAIASDGSATVSWVGPPTNGVAIDRYKVEYSSNGGGSWINAGISNGSSLVVPGLTNGVAHIFRVAATNVVGDGDWSEASAPVTPRAAASSPAILSTVPGNGSVALSWSTPAGDGGSPIVGYVVEISGPGGVTEVSLPVVNAYTATGLQNGSAYSFRVRAQTVVAGQWSAASAAVTPLGLPVAPTGVVAMAASGAAEVSWSAVSATGGSPVTGYVIRHVSSRGTVDVAVGAGTSATVTGLVNGTPYQFQVAARTAAGQGAFSALSAPVTPGTQAAPPVRVSGTVSSNAVRLRWSAPRTRGITDYVVQYSTNGGATWTTAAEGVSKATTATITGLQNGVVHRFRVAAVVGGIVGRFSAPTVPLMPFNKFAKPEAPVIASVSAMGGGTYSLRVNPVTSSEGGAVTDYVIQYRVNSGSRSRWVTYRDGVNANTTTTLRGLRSSAGYVFRVAAKNKAGTGAYSSEATAFSPIF